MKVLVGCEYSGIVSRAFREQGHEVYSCDILPTEADPQWHHQGDIVELLQATRGYWDLMIAHPPCTYLTNAGVKHLHQKVNPKGYKERWENMKRGAVFFNTLLHAEVPRICIENPPPHKYGRALISSYTQLIRPHQFGELTEKGIGLWLRNLPPLKPTLILDITLAKYLDRQDFYKIHYMKNDRNRGHNRSRFYVGIAQAMAEQWQ